MPRLTDVQAGALGTYWNEIRSVSMQGFTATETISYISDFTKAAGGTFSFEESKAVASLFGYARRMDNAANVVQSLNEPDVIGPEAISTPPWAREEQEMNAFPMWHVHFDLTTIDESGNQVTDRKVSVFRMTLPSTMGELQRQLDADAEAMAKKYGHDFVSAEIKEIHSV